MQASTKNEFITPYIRKIRFNIIVSVILQPLKV
jgi:hypothetical protein